MNMLTNNVAHDFQGMQVGLGAEPLLICVKGKVSYLLLILLIQSDLQTRACVAALICKTATGKGRRGRGEELLGHLF